MDSIYLIRMYPILIFLMMKMYLQKNREYDMKTNKKNIYFYKTFSFYLHLLITTVIIILIFIIIITKYI